MGCPSCGTELSGHFGQCRFCQLEGAERALLEVFLRSRGNVKDVQAFLGVSYPTARQRVGELLAQLGFSEAAAPTPAPATSDPTAGGRAPAEPAPEPDRSRPEEVLADLAAGLISVSQAERKLAASYPGPRAD